MDIFEVIFYGFVPDTSIVDDHSDYANYVFVLNSNILRIKHTSKRLLTSKDKTSVTVLK